MHIPDGLLDPKISQGLMGAALTSLVFCLAKAKREITQVVPQRALAFAGEGMINAGNRTKKMLSKVGEKKIFLIILVSSLIFAVQMFDFSIGEGAKGHLIGAFFSSLILGPFAGTIAVSLTLILQAIFLSDGGIFALGANIINMAFLGSFASYYFYGFLMKYFSKNISIGISAWVSVVLAASAYAIETGISGNSNFVKIIFMHSKIGIAEAAATLILAALFRKLIGQHNNADISK